MIGHVYCYIHLQYICYTFTVNIVKNPTNVTWQYFPDSSARIFMCYFFFRFIHLVRIKIHQFGTDLKPLKFWNLYSCCKCSSYKKYEIELFRDKQKESTSVKQPFYLFFRWAGLNVFSKNYEFSVLSRNQVKSISEFNSNFWWLQSFILLSDRFGELVDLVELDLGDNGIAKLPESFGFLFNLRKISFDNNALTNLPESWINLKK